jgi:hypothetical protein
MLKLRLDSISVKDLVDTGSFYDAQDPAVIITVGDHVLKTER